MMLSPNFSADITNVLTELYPLIPAKFNTKMYCKFKIQYSNLGKLYSSKHATKPASYLKTDAMFSSPQTKNNP